MERPPETTGIPEQSEAMIRAAKVYAKLGYRPLVLLPGTKQSAVYWKQFQTRFPTELEIEEMFSLPYCNLALLTGMGTVVVDVDDPTLLEAVIAHCGDTPMRSRTPRGGFHLWYRMRNGVTYGGALHIKGKALDLRGETHYSVEPWSRSKDGVPYEWLGPVLPASDLPLLKVSWLRDRRPKPPTSTIAPTPDEAFMERRARAWLAHVEGAVSGQGGHNRTFRVACKLTHSPPQGFGLDEDASMRLMLTFNENCEPPWSIAELQHKVRSAIRLK